MRERHSFRGPSNVAAIGSQRRASTETAIHGFTNTTFTWMSPDQLYRPLRRAQERLGYAASKMPISFDVTLEHARENPLKDTLSISHFHMKPDQAQTILLERMWAGWNKENPVARIEVSHNYSKKSTDINSAQILSTIPGIIVFSPRNEREEVECIHQALSIASEMKPELIVFDHRGLVTKVIHESYRNLIPLVRSVILITGSAKATMCQLEGPEVPIIPLYESFWKKLEARVTARSIVKTMETKVQVDFSGTRVAVFGYGDVGKPLAHLLSRKAEEVVVVDTDPLKHAAAECDGFRVGSEKETPRCDIVITVTGFNPLSEPEKCVVKAERLLDLARTGKITSANGGSGNQEIDRVGLERMVELGLARKDAMTVQDEIVGTSYEAFDGTVVELCGDGLPINLKLGDGNPIRVMDVVQATMLELTCYSMTKRLPPGLHAFPLDVDLEVLRHVRKIYRTVSSLLRGD